MDTATSPTPEDERRDALLGHVRHFILRHLTLIETRIAAHGSAPLPAALIRFLRRRFLVPAEAALRRAILIMAADLPPEARPPATASSKHADTSLNLPKDPPSDLRSTSRRPVFRMSETEPREPIPTYLKAAMAARMTILDLTAPVLPPAPAKIKSTPDPAQLTQTFRRRLEAFAAAYENPVREARRWLRRYNAQCRRPEAKLRAPLSFVHPPGLHKRLSKEATLLLQDVNRAAFNAVALRRDTS